VWLTVLPGWGGANFEREHTLLPLSAATVGESTQQLLSILIVFFLLVLEQECTILCVCCHPVSKKIKKKYNNFRYFNNTARK